MKRWVGVREVSDILGRSQASVRHLTSRGLIPHRKICGRVCFNISEVEAWADQSPGVRLEDLENDQERSSL